MLHPSLTGGVHLDQLRAKWRTDGCLRIEPFLCEQVAEDLLGALRAEPFTLRAPSPSNFDFQYREYSLRPEDDCDHFLCSFGRWLFGDAARWVSDLTGQGLGPPADRLLLSTLYAKGSYLDAHNDYDGERRVAFVLGLTRESWPAEDGGHLEFLAVEDQRVLVKKRCAPGWNSLDLFDVSEPTRLHRIPILTRLVERRAITGWFYSIREARPDET